jgi:hypothetical protein
MASLIHEDLLAYEHFLADPQLAARWVRSPALNTPIESKVLKTVYH